MEGSHNDVSQNLVADYTARQHLPPLYPIVPHTSPLGMAALWLAHAFGRVLVIYDLFMK